MDGFILVEAICLKLESRTEHKTGCNFRNVESLYLSKKFMAVQLVKAYLFRG